MRIKRKKGISHNVRYDVPVKSYVSNRFSLSLMITIRLVDVLDFPTIINSAPCSVDLENPCC
jgi:hypothetical protein